MPAVFDLTCNRPLVFAADTAPQKRYNFAPLAHKMGQYFPFPIRWYFMVVAKPAIGGNNYWLESSSPVNHI